MTFIRAALFLPEEHRVLSSWLGAEPQSDLPETLTLQDAFNALGFDSEPTVHSKGDAAVASIVLERVQERLPQWASVSENEIVLGRNLRERRAIRTVELTPRRLLSINWASSGPGFDWPEQYFVTYVPVYDVHVVTGSFDSDDGCGFTDIALGHFPGDEDILRCSEKIVRDEWLTLRNCDQERWEQCYEGGLIKVERAVELADETWPPEAVEEDDDDADQAGLEVRS